VKFLCEQCKAKYQIADDKIAGRTVRMKCRKCGHLIEMRAAVMESSIANALPSPVPPADTPAPSPVKPPSKALPPRATPLAASLTAHRPAAPKPDRLPSALAGAFKTNVQREREEEVSAPFDMSELSQGNDWYVAVNGVPVGPVRIAEIRRKASMGAVTEDSLVWQEGLDEWRPLRTFPDLAATVREAAAGGRSSVLPAPGSGNPPRSPSAWPMAPSVGQRAAPQRMAPVANPPLARSNVVAITSRLATAERLEEPPQVGFGVGAPLSAAMAAPATETRAVPAMVAPAVVTDPFASAAAAQSAAAAVPSAAPPYRAQKGPPLWFLLLLLAIGGAFGITAALALFVWKTQAPAPAVVQAPVPSLPSAASAGAPSAAGPSPVNIDTVPVVIAANGGLTRPAGGSPTAPKASATPSAAGRTLDLHGIGAGPTIAPVDNTGNDGPKAAGSCLSEGQVQQTIGLHRVAIQRSCWERSSNGKLAVNVSVLLTIAADGSPQGVAASGDDPSVAKCIENDVKGWHFPAMGCSQRTSIPFHFVRQ